MSAPMPWTLAQQNDLKPLVALRLKGRTPDILCPIDDTPLEVDPTTFVTGSRLSDVEISCPRCQRHHLFTSV